MTQKSVRPSPKPAEMRNNFPMPNLIFYVLLCGFSFAAQAQVGVQDRYQVRFDDKLETVSIQACFGAKPPTRLYHNSQASRFASPISGAGVNFRLQSGAESTRIPDFKPNSCLNWEVDINKAASQSDIRFAMRVGSDIVTDGDLWFWRGSGGRKVRVEVSLPAGINISVPWKQIGEPESQLSRTIWTFKPYETNAAWTSRIAVGRFSKQVIPIAGSQIQLAILGSLPVKQNKKLTQWVRQSSSAVATVNGSFPQLAPQLLVVPIGPRSNPVPWAHVMRGGGVSAEFFVDETRPLEDLTADWTACHELSHMLLPFVSSRDRWLSEGLASYYQYILLARSGMLTEQEAWQGMFDGLQRGKNGTNRRKTLAEATLEGRDHTMRIYWSGAAIMLKADVQIRIATENKHSLDTTLASLQSCCMDTDKRWRADELFKRLDRLSGTHIFSQLYDQHVNSKYFPDLTDTWQSLGISSHSNQIAISETATWSSIRTAIMQK